MKKLVVLIIGAELVTYLIADMAIGFHGFTFSLLGQIVALGLALGVYKELPIIMNKKENSNTKQENEESKGE